MHRINFATMFIYVLLAGLIQATAFDNISIFGIKPDLLLIMTAFFSLFASGEDGLKAALVAGLLKDISSSSIFGSYTISFALIALLLNYHQSKFYKERASTQAMLGFCCYILMGFMALLCAMASHKTSMLYYPFPNIIFKGALYTAAVSPFVFFILSKMLRIHLTTSL